MFEKENEKVANYSEEDNIFFLIPASLVFIISSISPNHALHNENEKGR